MALDAATLALTAAELKATLTDAKIAKIFEPTRDELVITLRTRTDTYALLLSARSGSARVCLTEETFENPETPPSFCMLMRKHLTGGRLLDVHMEPGDRIVYFDFQCTNEMGDLVRNTLCAELMGRYSNLVLVQSGKIIDALKRVDFEDSDVRQLLPGLPYTTPPKPARPDFLQVSAASIVAAACQRELPVRAPKKEKRQEEKTVFLLLGPEGVALRQRPDTGLLAGLWEYPHVPGRLTEEQAAQQLRAWGLTAHRWLRQLEARHLFTHIRWDMTGYLVQVEGRGPEDWLWADGTIRARLAVPSAFEKFTRALPAEGE